LKQDALQASKPPEENGLSLSHLKIFCFHIFNAEPW